MHRREHPQCFSRAFDKRKSSQCLLQEPNLLFFSQPATQRGLQKAGGIYLDTEKWVPAECFPGPIRVAALCSGARHSVRAALSACQNKSRSTMLSAPAESALLSTAKSCRALQTPTEQAHGSSEAVINYSCFSFLSALHFCKAAERRAKHKQANPTGVLEVQNYQLLHFKATKHKQLEQRELGQDPGTRESQWYQRATGVCAV